MRSWQERVADEPIGVRLDRIEAVLRGRRLHEPSCRRSNGLTEVFVACDCWLSYP